MHSRLDHSDLIEKECKQARLGMSKASLCAASSWDLLEAP